MSKSRGNTVAPDPYIQKYGSDVFRTYLAFGFAYTDGGPWSESGLQAIVKFTGRIDRLVEEVASIAKGQTLPTDLTEDDKALLYALNYTIKAVTTDTEKFQFNTSIARLMELLNAIGKYQTSANKNDALLRSTVETFLLLYAPYAPHFTEELWERMGNDYSIFNQAWPVCDESKLVKDTVEIAVQINGQVKFRVNIAPDASSEDVEKIVKDDSHLEAALAGRSIVKFIYVKGRLANIVAK